MIVPYVMTVCTASWVLCGQIEEVPQPSREACIAERAEMYRLQGRDAFKWITCEPAPKVRREQQP